MVKKFVRVVVAALALVLLLVVAAATVVTNFIVIPAKVTPVVTEILQKQLRSEVAIGAIDVTLLSSFPNISLQIDSLVIKQEVADVADLISAQRCRIAINPLGLLKKELIVSEILLEKPSINLFVDERTSPMALLNVDPSQDDAEELEEEEVELMDVDSVARSIMSEYGFRLKKFRVDSAQFVIDDRLQDFYSIVDGFSVDMSLEATPEGGNLSAEWGFGELSLRLKEKDFATNTRFKMVSELRFDRDSMLLTIEKNRFSINKIRFGTRGTLRVNMEEKALEIDLKSRLSTPSLEEFFGLVPSYIFEGKDEMTTSGSVMAAIDVTGKWSEDVMPDIFAKLKIEEGRAKYASRRVEIENIECDAEMQLDLNNPKNSYATISRFNVNTSGIIDLTVSADVTNLINDPTVDVKILSDIDFTRFSELFPLKEALLLQGKNNTNVRAKFRVADIEQSNFGALQIDGESRLENIVIDIDGTKVSGDASSTTFLSAKIDEGALLFGDRVLANNNSRTLLATLNFGGFAFKDKDGTYGEVKKITTVAGANFDRITNRVNGVGMQIETENLKLGQEGLYDVDLGQTSAEVRVTPRTEAKEATAKATIKSSQFTATERAHNSKVELSSAEFNLDMERRAPRDWATKGDVGFAGLAMYTDLFPTKVSIPRSKVSMDGNTITLRNTRLNVGESSIVATGSISNLLEVLFLNAKVPMQGDLRLNSKFIDINELFAVINKSVLVGDGESVEEASADAEAMQMLLVPKGINFAFNLNIDKIALFETTVESVIGDVTISNGIVSLNKLALRAIGAKAEASLAYKNVDEKSSDLYLDFTLRDADITRIGELMPTIHTMIPMMDSFEGVVDFSIIARSPLNETMDLDIAKLRSAIAVRGSNLVVMDGDTFAQVSKMLLFKNKERNLIDNLQVYITAENAKVDVLPFELNIDRYSTVIGGSQTINPKTFAINYNYNVSILKSPLPFKAGVDITGDIEDFKFKIARAKLKGTDLMEVQKQYIDLYQSVK